MTTADRMPCPEGIPQQPQALALHGWTGWRAASGSGRGRRPVATRRPNGLRQSMLTWFPLAPQQTMTPAIRLSIFRLKA